ncbi:hypothetical protein [Clostridium sp.]|uniref:hypothetical protein n=1 Tax=Clostridium sp. TaxID=1506 RepID=UPI003217DAC5
MFYISIDIGLTAAKVAIFEADKTATEITCHGKSVAYGKDPSRSSMCTVFAESEVISLIGTGRKKILHLLLEPLY